MKDDERARLLKALAETREALAAFDPLCGSARDSAEALCAERNHYRRRAGEMHVRAQEAEAALNHAMRAGLAECERLRSYEAAFHVAMDRAERAEGSVATAVTEIQRLRSIEEAAVAYTEACRAVADIPFEMHQLLTGQPSPESVERAANTYVAAEQTQRAAFDTLVSLLPKRSGP